MKIIFLDVDGVLNSNKYVIEGKVPIFSGYHTFADELLERLKTIVAATDAKIVLSSTWRLFEHDTTDDSMFLYLERGLDRFGMHIMSCTGQRRDRIRGLEIQDWLAAHKVEKFVAIDDDYMDIVDIYPNQTVCVRGDIGLTDEDVQKAIAILNS